MGCLSCDTSGFAAITNNLKRNHFSILSQNIRSLDANFEKFTEFLQQINEESKYNFLFSVIAMQETWQFQVKHNIPHYQKPIARTRSLCNGGGVDFFIREGI